MAKTNKAAPVVKQDQRYQINQLRAHSQELFGVSPYVIDGAFAGKSGAFSIAEAKQIIDAFKSRPVRLG